MMHITRKSWNINQFWRQKKLVVMDSLLYCFCEEKEETISHFFFECRITWLVWSRCYALVGLKLADHLESASHFLHFNLFDTPTVVNLAFRNTIIVLVSEIWCHRNKHIFKVVLIDQFEIFSYAQLKVLGLNMFFLCCLWEAVVFI